MMLRWAFVSMFAVAPLIAAPPATIEIDTPMAAPAWALLERRLLAEQVPACREFFTQVLRRSRLRAVLPSLGRERRA